MTTEACVLSLVCVALIACTAPAPPEEGLTVLIPRDAEQLDPRFVTDPYGLKVSRVIFASLITIDPRTLAIEPDLAESFEWRSDCLLYPADAADDLTRAPLLSRPCLPTPSTATDS